MAEAEGEIVGTVVAGFDGVRGWIYHLGVHPRAQRKGIATRLMKTAEDALGRLGCPKVNLQVRMNNAAVVAFYRTIGYEVEERINMGKRLPGRKEKDANS